jgi:hypothetical protein
VAAFIKKRQDVAITGENLQEVVMFKQISSDPLEDLLDKMNNDYVKKLLQQNDWPDGVKKEFVNYLHRFMAFLNETYYQQKG